jgi:glutathione peroxidase
MKYLIIIAVVALLGFFGVRLFSSSQKPGGAKSTKSIYDYSYTSIDGKVVKLDTYRGKKILFVNVASKCGFTPQYDDLEKLYKEEKDKLVVIGFPANDFAGQEPGTNEEIASFCRLNYGVSFPMSQKIHVVGEGKDPIYQWLTDKSLNGWNSAEPKWNFHKYLVSETGELLGVYPSATKPGSVDILSHLR